MRMPVEHLPKFSDLYLRVIYVADHVRIENVINLSIDGTKDIQLDWWHYLYLHMPALHMNDTVGTCIRSIQSRLQLQSPPRNASGMDEAKPAVLTIASRRPLLARR
jgi:hypothetical protein